MDTSGIPLCHIGSHTRIGHNITPSLVDFNGMGDQGHETFYFQRDLPILPIREDKGKVFQFCKTNHQPYDICVVGCLLLAKIHFWNEDVEDVIVRSDGELEDWEDGAALVTKATGYVFEFSWECEDWGIEVKMIEKKEPPPPPEDPIKRRKEVEEFKQSPIYDLIG